MSQSDFLKYKRISTILNVDNKTPSVNSPNKLPAVLNAEDYVSYKEYALENSLINSKCTPNQLQDTTVLNMELYPSNCPTFACTNTNTRPNRVLNPKIQTAKTSLPTAPLNFKTAEMLKLNTIQKTKYCCGRIHIVDGYIPKKYTGITPIKPVKKPLWTRTFLSM